MDDIARNRGFLIIYHLKNYKNLNIYGYLEMMSIPQRRIIDP